MTHPEFVCECCGSSNIRRSRRQSVFEIPKMLIGSYPFRCNNCSQRFWVNVWLFSTLAFTRCPKCLRMELTTWPRGHYRTRLWKSLLTTFGAQRYYCEPCRCRFVSFRPKKNFATEPAVEPTESGPTPESAPTEDSVRESRV